MNVRQTLLGASMLLCLAACSGGGSSSGESAGTGDTVQDAPVACDGSCANANTFLTTADVQTILAQAIQEAQAHNVDAAIAVSDRVGNILAVYRMGATPQTVLIASEVDGSGAAVIDSGLEGIELPIDTLAAIAKAVTGAYLSSEGNAFSSRTASQIVQENFNPGEMNQPAGPLFGVQFSQLSCSDFTLGGAAVGPGPRRSPLGLSADPGGLPLYKEGTVVGGIGVIADGLYSLDKVISDSDRSVDEMIAYAGTFNYAAPTDRRGDRITVDGKTFRFSDVEFSDLLSNPEAAAAFSSVPASVGALQAVIGYTDGTVKQGLAFGEPGSGIRADTALYPDLDAFVFVDGSNANRFPPTAGTAIGGDELTANEVQVVLQEALAIANRARAQIRRPLGSPARVTISVVDTSGEVLGMVRTRDAPVFGADVSLQKARTAALYSSPTAAAFFQGLPDAAYINNDLSVRTTVSLGDYVTAVQGFGLPTALTDGAAFSDRAGGNLSRPFFPDGLMGTPHGPFSKPAGSWSIFSTGMQLDLVINGMLQHVLFATGNSATDAIDGCAGFDLTNPMALLTDKRAHNGIQIFPGSVPIYRGNTLIGGIGVSGDGIDQDDMISFLGVHNAAARLSGSINNAPAALRADTLAAGPSGTLLRYVQCPQAPFNNSSEQNVCDGK